MDSDGGVEIALDHPKSKKSWSARWALDRTTVNDKGTSRLTLGAPYAILLLTFGLAGVSAFLDSGKIIPSSPEAILEFKRLVAASAVKPGSPLPERPACFISNSSADIWDCPQTNFPFDGSWCQVLACSRSYL
jgi:hypothetical protein